MNDSLIGSEVAGYRIERMLGRGGMASVYFAWDTKHERAVALKVLDERYRETPSYVERFVREAQAIMTWDSPNIVRVFDAGEENQIYYYAMEFIRGMDLAQLLRQYLDAGQLMPYNEVARIGSGVASALDYAHDRGIIHRDVKPSNVLVSVDGRILLSDFGLVMDIQRGTLGETFGSPAYIAPEQARNSANAVPQSDIYALGVMLYEMLTGTVPFYDASPMALALKHLTEEPPRPRELNPRLNATVEAVLLRALRKDPRERYATGHELVTALERALKEELRRPEASASTPLPSQTQALRTRRALPQAVDLPVPASAVRQESAAPTTAASGAVVQPGPGPRAAVDAPPEAIMTRPAPSPARPAARSGRYVWGCLGALILVGLLAAVTAAVLAFARPGGLALFAPAATARPTTTGAPQPSPTAQPSATLEPTTASAPPQPSATPEPRYRFLYAVQKSDGFVLVNTGALPVPVAALQINDAKNKLALRGSSWNVETLQPGQCMSAWTKNAKPSFPAGIQCEPVGKVLLFEPKQRFWQDTVIFLYNKVEVARCQPTQARCEFEAQPAR